MLGLWGSGTVHAEQQPFSAPHAEGRLHAIRIDHLFNSKSTSVNGENDGVGFRNGSTYPSEFLPTGLWAHEGVPVSSACSRRHAADPVSFSFLKTGRL